MDLFRALLCSLRLSMVRSSFVAFVSSTHIQAGQFGYYGLPAIAFIYGFIRALMDKNAAQSKTEMMERIYSIDTKVTLIKRLVKQIDSGKGEAASTEES